MLILWTSGTYDINAVSVQLLERFVELLFDLLSAVGTGCVRIPFRRHREATLFPAGISTPCFLLASDIDSRRVDFSVALRLRTISNFSIQAWVSPYLEVVEAALVCIEVQDSSTRLLVWAECHSTQDDPGLACSSHERHFVANRSREVPGEKLGVREWKSL